MGKYDDIINLPHHVSTTRHHMSMQERAAQFQPFRALNGYEAALGETARLTEDRIELTEDEKALLEPVRYLKAARIGEGIFRRSRREAAGILCVFQG